MNYPMIN